MIRVVGWLLRFIYNAKRKNSKTNLPYLKCDELNSAESLCAKIAQRETFGEEYCLLLNNKPISKHSKLFNLSPCLVEGFICLKSRITRSPNLKTSEVRPIILDSKHRFVKLLIQKYHRDLAHQGQETVINEIRRQYWILNVRSLVRSCWRSCVECQKRRAKPTVPEMSPLPTFRVTKNLRPFTNVGLDYFGPIEVKIGRRREKRYGALFTCLSIRAVHIELASSLSTDSAIMAIRRMAARRGYPTQICSDNGTNFRGADKELRSLIENIDNDEVGNFCAAKNIKWTFITPAAPHMGGCWERLVRSVKTSLYTIMKEQAPREETLHTVLCEIENIINSRPLTFVSLDPEDPESLTPNHFLIADKSELPVIPLSASDLRKQWRLAQSLADKFWKRWVREYLPGLMLRPKWTQASQELKVGDLVLMVDEHQPRNYWLTGLIAATHPGSDGKIRSLDVKTKLGIYRRPAVKLVKIKLDDTYL